MTSAAVGTPAERPEFIPARVEEVFNQCFATSCNTRLRGGADEPLYVPAVAASDDHILYYRGDFFASALHEVAHWCIAGVKRRRQRDFGYWYTPQNRSAEQQRAFEAVECKPQALEWFFSRACNYPFGVSTDNLDLANTGKLDVRAFERRVLEQALIVQKVGLPMRAAVFYAALCHEFGTSVAAEQLHFTLGELAR